MCTERRDRERKNAYIELGEMTMESVELWTHDLTTRKETKH